MIAIFSILFCISAALLVFCVWQIRNVKKNFIVSLFFVITASLVSATSHIFIINTSSISVAYFFYSLFYISIDVMLLSLLDFSWKYTKYEVRLPKLKYVFFVLALLDCVSILLNNIFHHVFVLSEVSITFGATKEIVSIFKAHGKIPFQLHLYACYIIILLTIIVLLLKIAKSPKFYRFKYITILFVLLIPVIGDGIYVFTPFPINFPIIFYTTGAILLTFYSVHSTPSLLLQRQLSAVVSNMNDSVAIFDIDGENIYENDAMFRLKERYSKIGLSPMDPFVALSDRKTYEKIKRSPDRDFDEEITRNNHTYTFHILIRHLKDENENFLGLFFIVHDKTEEMEKLNRERYLAVHDPLTNLYNRNGFYEKVKTVLASNPDEAHLMVCADVDNFKLINDLFGRETGDEFLMRAADAIRMYTKENEVSARLSSDHFALLMRKADYKEQIFIDYPSQVSYLRQDLHYPVMFHIGVYEIEDITMPVSVMCDRAFMAIKPIKGNLKKSLAYYDSSLRKEIINEQRLIGDFPEAINSEQFKMYLQPQVSTDGNVFGAEALVRWEHPKDGILPPQKFIPIFEKKGLIANLDMYIWDLAAQKLKEWQEKGIDKYISVNISPRDFIYVDIYRSFTKLVQKYQISPKKLKLEITESAILSNFENQILLIQKLRDFGFEIEMDDFGSGYSSLNLLKDIPFDILKIDMAFLQETENKDRSEKILKSIIMLSKSLDMLVITEGVETKEQVEFLKELGTDFYQGFYFSKPLSVTDFEKL